jgi:hypothetical protein
MHPDVSELSLVGGHPALDLVNTLERGIPLHGEPPYDFLSDTSALLLWTLRVGLISDAEANRVGRAWREDPAAAHAGLAAVRDLREGLHLAMLAPPRANRSRPGPPWSGCTNGGPRRPPERRSCSTKATRHGYGSPTARCRQCWYPTGSLRPHSTYC